MANLQRTDGHPPIPKTATPLMASSRWDRPKALGSPRTGIRRLVGQTVRPKSVDAQRVSPKAHDTHWADNRTLRPKVLRTRLVPGQVVRPRLAGRKGGRGPMANWLD